VLNKVPHLFVACVSLDRDAGGLFEIPLGESRTPEAIRHPLDDGGIHFSRNVLAMKYVNGPFYGATDMAFDAGDTALVTAGLDRKVRLWAQQPLREIEVIGRHNVAVSAVALGFDHRLVASADRDGRVAVWRRAGAPAAVEVARFTPGKWDGLAGRGAKFDPRHEWITGSVEDGPDQVIVDLVSRASRGGPFGQISSDGKFALLSVSQSTSAIQEIASERQVASFPAHSIQEGHLSGNFEWVATVTNFTNIAFANALPGRPSAVRILLDWRPGKGDNRDPLLGINDEGTLLVCRHGAKTASIIRVSHQAGTATTVAVVECSEFIGFLGQDRYAAVIAEGQGCVRVIDTSSGADVAKLPFQDRALSDPTINASRTVLYTLQTQWSKVQQEETPGFSGTQIPFTVHLWSVEHGALSIILRGRPITLDLHPDGRRLACSFYDGAVTMLDTSDGRPLCTFDGYGFVLGFSSDGKRLVTVTHEGRVFLYDGAPIDEKQTSDAIGPSFLENFEETLVAIKARKAARGK
jgi:WD40 repeat protein